MKWNSYEISLWTHQEVYLATLCNSQNFRKYDANSPILNCSTTGQTSLTFSIPIVCYNLQTGELEDNTIWYNKLKTEKSLANEKRVKLIFDKYLSTRRIMEFVITTMEQSRNGEELYCNVTCSGLAFKWLGKIGYDITLDSDTMLLQQEQLDAENSGVTLYPTINYWLDKIFPHHIDSDTKQTVWDTFWQYEISMNYQVCVGTRENDKVYQDDDVVSWKQNDDGSFTAVYNTEPIQKERFISVEQSNKYNITQDIAEQFEVYARYEFVYDDESNPYRATAGKVIFYNELTQDTEYVISYGNNETGLTKTSQSADIVTKMYVNPVEDEYSDTGYVSLSQAAANKMGQEYIFNFDYYLASGEMTSAQQDAISTYENKIRSLNTKIEQISAKRNEVQTNITDNSVTQQNAYDSMVAAQTLVNDYNTKISTIKSQITTSNISNMSETVTISKQTSDNYYYYNFSRQGIDSSSISCTTLSGSSVSGYTVVIDQLNCATGVRFNNTESVDTLLKFTYNYNLLQYYEAAKTLYTAKANQAQSTYQTYYQLIGDEDDNLQAQIDGTYYQRLKYWKQAYDDVAEEKESVTNDFEQLMGYFIKQGKWDASDFSVSYENKTKNSPNPWNCGYMAANFSDAAKDSEVHSYYQSGTNLDKVYYDFVELDQQILKNVTNYDEFSILEHYTDATGKSYVNVYTNSAHGSIQFLKVYSTSNTTKYWIIPVFIFQNSNRQINPQQKNWYLTYRYNSKDAQHSISYSKFHRVSSTALTNDSSINSTFTLTDGFNTMTVSAAGTVVYRRIQLSDDNVADTSIVVKTKNGDETGTTLDEYEDYLYYKVSGTKTITFKISNHFPAYLDTTILPLLVSYKVDRSSQQLYYDAKDVLKNSAFPQVSYEVEFAYLKQCKHYRDDYISNNDNIDLQLGCIVRINDWNMGLKNVKGIVTQYSVDIDSPQNTKFTISNYKTRFEDLFGRIVAQTQALQSNTGSYDRAASAITADGQISVSILQNTISNNKLIFNSGYNTNVTWDQNGIIAENSLAYANGVTGQVAIKGSGILLSNSTDDNNNRVYTTAITADGINASAMTVGRLDTQKINIYSGDDIRFMWNAQGLFAYSQNGADSNNGLIQKYICYNQNGLKFYQNSTETVSLGWDGLYIGAQDGAVEITGDDGLSMYNGPSSEQDRSRLLHVGKYKDINGNIYYGFRLFNTENKETFIADNTGALWLKDTIQIGKDSSTSGLTATNQENIDSPIRIWAGAEFDFRDTAPFWVKQDGSIRSTKGTIGGWTITEYGINSNGISLIASHTETNNKGESELVHASISVSSSDGARSVTIGDDGQLTAKGVSISGNIQATGGTIGNVSIASIVGDTSNINFKITSDNGNVSKYGQTFVATLTLTGYKGYVQFDDDDYKNYDYQWQSSAVNSSNDNDWKDINGAISRTYTINQSFSQKYYYRCQATKNSTDGGAS